MYVKQGRGMGFVIYRCFKVESVRRSKNLLRRYIVSQEKYIGLLPRLRRLFLILIGGCMRSTGVGSP